MTDNELLQKIRESQIRTEAHIEHEPIRTKSAVASGLKEHVDVLHSGNTPKKSMVLVGSLLSGGGMGLGYILSKIIPF